MIAAPFRVVLDANVLYPFRLQATSLKKPPVTLDDLLTGLGKTVPSFVAEVRRLMH
jgi:hypothetical protein